VIAQPAARDAASHEVALAYVSASSQVSTSIASIESTYAGSWTRSISARVARRPSTKPGKRS
jgi:hypothetical protein